MRLTENGQTADAVAIDFLRLHEPSEGYFLGFSGGKDSVVIKDLATRSGVRVDCHYNVSPIDPPEIHRFIRQFHPDVIWDYNARGFFKHVLTEGPPMRMSRWCCELIKESGGQNREKILGMRKAESTARSKYDKYEDDRSGTGHRVLPILSWSDEDVWRYIGERNLKVCSLYSEGRNRIGCVLCPYAGKAETAFQIIRFPKIAAAWRASLDRYFDVRIKRGTALPYTDKDEFWNWWISRE